VSDTPKSATAPNPVDCLLELIRRARTAETVAAVRFIAVNDTHLLAPYQQAALWFREGGVQALSGLIEVDANVPYVRWLDRVCASVGKSPFRVIKSSDLPAELREEWGTWLPPEAAWIPFSNAADPVGGVLLSRELPWSELELRFLSEWLQTWFCAYRALSKPTVAGSMLRGLSRIPKKLKQRPLVWSVVVLIIVLFPVRLSVLAPAEMVPANPIAVRAPLDGVVKTFFVRSNETVKAGQPLFAYDDTALAGRLEVATEAWRTTEAEQRQLGQLALNDAKARGALAAAKGAVEEKRIEVDFLRAQLERNRVLAPRGGIVFVDDANEWVGRPVVAGQRILRLAEPQDKEIEAWLSVGDAIALPERAEVRLYLSSSPLRPVSGNVRLVSYEASRRPDGSYAYRLRATLTGTADHRVGLKGTARVSGNRVPLIYWVLRRPLAAMRTYLGV
jgi:multidrug resistance efflux pump